MMACGRREVMLIMMMRDAPFPTPNVVIWSAIHITNSAAEVIPITVIRWNPMPGLTTISVPAKAAPRAPGWLSIVAMPHDWTTQRTIVR